MDTLKIPFLFSERYVAGGPIRVAPDNVFRVKLAAEIEDVPADIVLPIADFSVPTGPYHEIQEVLYAVLKRLSDGLPVYVGCAGGRGRTGLFLALLCKAAGVVDPVAYVRTNYNRHAVETPEQEAYVENFPVWALAVPMFFLSMNALYRDWNPLTNR